jgi:peptidoglycan hydrolase FlgJ
MIDPISPIGSRPGADPLAALRSGRIKGGEARLQAAVQLLEGTFYQELFKAMRETVPEGGALSPGSGQEMFEGLMDQHIADAAASTSRAGIGDALYRYFTTGRVSSASSEPDTSIVQPSPTESDL